MTKSIQQEMYHPPETIEEIDIQYVKGVGEARAKKLKDIEIYTVKDLLNFIPRRYLDRTSILPIHKLANGLETTVVGRVIHKEKVYGKKNRLGRTSFLLKCDLVTIW